VGATRVITYAYDGVQRLTDAVECPGSTYHYGYDPASNRPRETIDGVGELRPCHATIDVLAVRGRSAMRLHCRRAGADVEAGRGPRRRTGARVCEG